MCTPRRAHELPRPSAAGVPPDGTRRVPAPRRARDAIRATPSRLAPRACSPRVSPRPRPTPNAVLAACGVAFAVLGGSDALASFSTLPSLGRGSRDRSDLRLDYDYADYYEDYEPPEPASRRRASRSRDESRDESRGHSTHGGRSTRGRSSHESSSRTASSTRGKKKDVKVAHKERATGVTSKCLNVPADNAAGTYQFQDHACADGSIGSVPGCMGDKSNCRFCQTTIVPSKHRNEGWPTCPAAVCKEMKTLGCAGESVKSKREVLWQLAREKAIRHNEQVRGIGVGKCQTTPADRKIGRHQYSDASCADVLDVGCLGGGSTCRFCQLSTAKHQTDWPTCPHAVCEKWGVKRGCEAPLALVAVPPKHPPRDFDVKSAIKDTEKGIAKFIYDKEHPAQVKGGKASAGDGLIQKTKPTGDIVVDLLQSKARGARGVDAHLLRPKAGKMGDEHGRARGGSERESAKHHPTHSAKHHAVDHHSSKRARSKPAKEAAPEEEGDYEYLDGDYEYYDDEE